jgi:hypothetical protein
MTDTIPEIYDIDITYNISMIKKQITLCREYTSIENLEIIEEPVFIIESLHSCYAHAVIDCCFPIFWIIEELIKYNSIKNRHVRFLILENDILQWPQFYSPLINISTKEYKGVWNDIIKLLSPFPVIFQHLSETNYLFKQCIRFKKEYSFLSLPNIQRTPWNCREYYPSRPFSIHNVRFDDITLYRMLDEFRNYVFKYYSITETIPNNNLIIIERKSNRKIHNELLDSLTTEAKKNITWNFKGVIYLEDMSLSEQVALFNSTRFFIFRHGSCLTNLLWIPRNSVIFELTGGPENSVNSPSIITRLTKLSDSIHISLNYETINSFNDIFSKVLSFSNTWRKIADEGNQCINVSIGSYVRYGAKNSWIVKQIMTESFPATNAYFSDPLPYTRKIVEILELNTSA